jgi:hypothetical protein
VRASLPGDILHITGKLSRMAHLPQAKQKNFLFDPGKLDELRQKTQKRHFIYITGIIIDIQKSKKDSQKIGMAAKKYHIGSFCHL